jgi:hypothetical protein
MPGAMRAQVAAVLPTNRSASADSGTPLFLMACNAGFSALTMAKTAFLATRIGTAPWAVSSLCRLRETIPMSAAP